MAKSLDPSNADKRIREYDTFKLKWMLNHGYTLRDMINSLAQYIAEDSEEYDQDDITQLFDEWELDIGFNDEIYPCFHEWLHNDREAE